MFVTNEVPLPFGRKVAERILALQSKWREEASNVDPGCAGATLGFGN